MSLSNLSVGGVPVNPVAAVADTLPAPIVAAPASNGVTLLDERNASVVDSRGRIIKVRKLGALDRMKLFRAIGADDSENRQLMHYAVMAASVTELDGILSSFPGTSLQVDALIGRLDDAGLEAVITALVALSPEAMEGVAVAAKNL